MRTSKLSGVVAAVLAVGGLALESVEAAPATPSTPITRLCTRLVGVGHRYTVVVFPCDVVKRF